MKHVLLLAAALLCSSGLFAKSWRVNNVDSSADFQSLDVAMETISAGDTLYLEGSDNFYSISEPVTTKVTVIGPGYFLEENPNTQERKTQATISGYVSILADGCTFEGVRFYDTINSTTVWVGANNVSLRKCLLKFLRIDDALAAKRIIKNLAVTQCYFTYGGILGSNNDECHNALITNNIFSSSSFTEGEISRMYDSVIENNTFVSGFEVTNNSGCTIKNNIVNKVDDISSTYNTNSTIEYNYLASDSDYISSVEGTTVSTDGKWQLLTSSPGMTAGKNGTQCGAFGGASPYILSGLANVPHIYEIDAPTQASPVDGLNVTVKIVSEK